MRPLSDVGLVIGLLSLLCLGCTHIRVYTDHDAAADFAKMQRFAWLDPPLRETPRREGAPAVDPFVHNTLLDPRVREAVETALVAKGYIAAGETVPDFLIRYEVVSRDVVRDSPIYVGGGYGRRHYGGGVVYSNTRTYQEGTLILDVIDPATEHIAWRGWAVSRTRDGHIDAAQVGRTVEAIVKKFPPPPPAVPPEEPPAPAR
jgi:hypothetical protein